MVFGLGELPKAYNPKVHGPYDPAVYYGPSKFDFLHFNNLKNSRQIEKWTKLLKHWIFSEDTPLGEVKVGELPKWLARRDKSIGGIGKAISRGYWRYCHNYVFPKRTKIAPVVHFFLGASVFFYLINYQKMGKCWLLMSDLSSHTLSHLHLHFCSSSQALQVPLVKKNNFVQFSSDNKR